MATAGAGGPTQSVSFVLDPASVTRLVNDISSAFTKAMAGAGAVFAKQMQAMGANAAANIKIATTAAQTLNTNVKNVGATYAKLHSNQNAFLTGASRNTIKETALMQSLGHSIREVVAELKKSGNIERQQHIAAIGLANTEGRVQVENIRNVGRTQFVEGQKNLIQVRENAKRRLLLTQQLFQHLVRFEKTLGTGIAGAAHGLSTGFSKVFTTVRGLFSKNDQEITTGFRKNGEAVERGLKRGNTSFNTGLNESLNKRERALQSSFTQQEHIVRRSVIRQEEQLTKLRTQTSKGVLGAVTGRGVGGGLGLGSLFGGLGVIGALTSTFTIGGEFTKGLSVLQAQLGLTGEQMKGVRALSIQLGNDITLPGVSALDAAQAIQTLTKTFGYLGPAAVDAAEKAAKGTLQLSRATGASAEDAAGIIGAAVNVFKIGADQAVSVADSVAVAISKAAGVSFTDFKDSFTQGATVFEQFVGPAESANKVITEFSTALAVLARSGITGENAGAGLKQFFIQGNKEGKKANAITADIVKRAGASGKIFFDSAGHARTFADSIDILRKGLVGLTDSQKASTLSTLFGSRSLTIANALVNTSAAEFTALEDSMNRQGAAADIAAAANTGLKGAFDALKSVIETVQIVFYEKVQKPLGKAVLWFAALTNEILFSNGAWHLFRRAILGAVAGIGAIIALKGAIETIKLLSTALTALTTPFGAILIVAALVGAAIALMSDNTSKLGQSLRDLTAPLTEGFGKLIGAKATPTVDDKDPGRTKTKAAAVTLVDIFTRLKFILTEDVIPAVSNAATWVGGHLVSAFKVAYHFVADTLIPIIVHFSKIAIRDLIGAFHATVRFVEEKLIPGFKTVYHYIAETLIPKITHVAGVIADVFVRAGHAVVDFWRMVKPYLDPLINGFSALGQGVGAIFTGDFSSLGAGFVAAGSGIAGTVAKTARSIGDALHPIINRIGQFFTDLFSPENIKKYLKGALNFINTLGYILGRIVSDPRLLKTIAIVGGVLVVAAVKIAFEFITGFFRGVIENLPTLFTMASTALAAGFKLVFANIGKVLIVALGLLAFGPTLAKLFRGAGVSAGDGFFAGLKTKAGNTKGFVSGLFGGPQGASNRQVDRFFKDRAREVGELNNQLRIFGSSKPVLNLSSSTKQVKDVQTEIRRLRDGMSDGEIAALRLRDAFTQAGVAAKGVKTGLGTALGGLGQIFKAPLKGLTAALSATNVYTGPATSGAKAFAGAFKTSLSAGAGQFKAGLKGALGAVQEFAKSQGLTTGQAFGHALGKAAIGAASIAGGFVAGKAEGAAGGSGIFSALVGGVVAGAAIGGPFGAAVGVFTAGASLIGTHFGETERKAKLARDAVKGFADELRGDFIDAINKGVLAAGNLDFKDVFGAGGNLDKLKADFITALGTLTAPASKLLGDLKLNLSANIIPLVTNSNGDKVKFQKDLDSLLLDTVRKLPSFQKLFGDVGTSAAAFKALSAAVVGGSGDQKDFAKNFFAIENQLKQTGQAAVEAADVLKNLGSTVADVPKRLNIVVGHTQRSSLPAETSVAETGVFAGVFAEQTRTVKAQTEEWQRLIRNGLSIDEANAKLHIELPPIPAAQLAAWQHDLDGIAKEIEGLQSLLDAFPGLWADAIAASVGATPEAITQANAVVAVAGAATGLTVDAGTVVGQANLDLSTQGVAKTFTDFLSGEITKNPLITAAEAQAALGPLQTAAIEAINASVDLTTPEGQAAAQAGADRVKAIFDATVASLPVQIDAQTALQASIDADKVITDYLNLHPGTYRIQAEVAIKNAQTNAVQNAADKADHGLPFKVIAPTGVLTGNPVGVPGLTPESLGLPSIGEFEAHGKAAHDVFVNALEHGADGGLVGNTATASTPESFGLPAIGEFESHGQASRQAFQDAFEHGGATGNTGFKGHGKQEGTSLNITPESFGAPAASDFRVHGKVTGDALVSGLAGAIRSKESKVIITTALTDLSTHTVTTAKGLFKVASPSKIFHGIGMFLTEGLANGINAGAQQVASNAAFMAQGAIDAAQGALDGGVQFPTITVDPPPKIPVPPVTNIPVVTPRSDFGTPDPNAEEKHRRWLDDVAAVTTAARAANTHIPVGHDRTGAEGVVFDDGRKAIAEGMAAITAAIAEGRRAGGTINKSLAAPRNNVERPAQTLPDIAGLARAFGYELARRPEVTNVNITEAANARATGRAAIAELRAERLLVHGPR